MFVINRDALPTHTYVGQQHGPSSVSLILSESEPGDGPRLHRHPYDETWLVQEGRVRAWIGDETGELSAGDIAVVPPHTPHRFQAVGEEWARLICIHANPTTVTDWLE